MKREIKITFKPSAKQKKAWDFLFDNETNFVGYGGAAYGGKSYLLCYWLTVMSVAYPGTAWGWAIKHLRVLNNTTLITLFKVFEECNMLPGADYTYNAQQNIITFYNKSVIFLIDTAYQPSDPLYTRFGGLELTGAAVDESAETDEDAIGILWTRTGRKKNGDYKIGRKFLETFNPDKGHVYRRYYKPWRDSELPKTYRFIQAFPADNPSPDAAEYVQGILDNSDKVTIERLIHGNFEYDDDPAKLMEYDKILDCFSNGHVPHGRKCITVDAARYGDDEAVIFGWSGFRLERYKIIPRSGLDELGGYIEQMREDMGIGKSDVIVDEDGVGGGLIDFNKYKGFINNATPLPSPKNTAYKQNFDNLKSQCSFGMASIVQNNNLYLGVLEGTLRQKTIEEMEQVKRKNPDSDGKMGVIPKDIIKQLIKRSPNYWDAIMMRYWFELKPRFITTATGLNAA
jgi:phage terminase large subunit